MAKNTITTLTVTSPAFENEGVIPIKYTCDGEGINPPLEITNIPEVVQSLAIIVEDPDAPHGTFDHWLVWNIPVTGSYVEENQNPGVSGNNSAGKTGYHPPCPPDGSHRYYFTVYGLNDRLSIDTEVSKQQLLDAMEPHLVSKGSLMGRYDRKRK